MKVAIIGSRRYLDKNKVNEIVDKLNSSDIVLSGGCRGVDSWAVERAKKRGIVTVEFLPKITEDMTYYEICEAYYSRNRSVVQHCDRVIAFVSSDRKGGTEYTIKQALLLNKPVKIIK